MKFIETKLFGHDPADIDALTSKLDRAANDIQALTTVLDGTSDHLQRQGLDTGHFKSVEWLAHKSALDAIANQLVEISRTVRRQKEAQEATSRS